MKGSVERCNGNTTHRRRIGAVVFDMDGVLVDSHPLHRKAWRQFLRTLGRKASDRELDYILDGRKRDEILRHFLGPLSAQQILEYGQRKDRFFRESEGEVQPMPGVKEVVQQAAARGTPIAVATSASEGRTRFTLQQLQLDRYLQSIVTGADVPTGKPAPDVYQMTCERLGVVPEHAVAFEDSVSGVQSAKAARLFCVGVLSHQSAHTLKAAGADLTIAEFDGLSLDFLEAELFERIIDAGRASIAASKR
jgi:beta-phosphoglucomutase